MVLFLLRQLWRLIIFVLGAYTLQVLINIFWPESGSRLAVFAACLIIYCLMAYFVIPAMFRLYHVIIDHDHIPVYATTSDGWPSDPVNIAVIAKNRDHLIKALKKAGWYEADPITLWSSLRIIWSVIFNTPYPTAPMSNLFLFNRSHDVGFQLPSNSSMSARTRHHVRFWRLEEPEHKVHDRGHFAYWSQKLLKLVHRDHQIWIGASTEDFRSIDIQWRTGRITHGVRHEANNERDFIIKTLGDSGSVRSVEISVPGEKYKFRGQSFRTIYTTNGSVKVVRLK